MEENRKADNAGNGFPDITGVKNTEELAAGALRSNEVPTDNASETVMASSVSDSDRKDGVRAGEDLPDSPEADENTLDAEFEALIKGKYRQAYKKRMENTVRRRLRNGKARSVSAAKPETDEVASVSCEKAEESNATEVAAPSEAFVYSHKLIEEQKNKNRSRPTENGVGESVGVVTRINVSALSGSDILGIIHRAGTGEKITF